MSFGAHRTTRGGAFDKIPPIICRQFVTPASFLAWRKRLGLNTVQAAKLLGCSRTALNGWEAGLHTIPRYIALACAALAYGLPEHP